MTVNKKFKHDSKNLSEKNMLGSNFTERNEIDDEIFADEWIVNKKINDKERQTVKWIVKQDKKKKMKGGNSEIHAS